MKPFKFAVSIAAGVIVLLLAGASFPSAEAKSIARTLVSKGMVSSANVVYTLGSDVPESMSDRLVIYSPSNHWLTGQPKLTVKGVNRIMTPVYVNGKRVSVRKDGRFVVTIPVTVGLQTVYISVESDDGKNLLTIRRDGYRYGDEAASSNEFGGAELFYRLGIAGVSVTSNPSAPLTRSQFALYLAQLVESGSNRRPISRPVNVEPDRKPTGSIEEWAVEQNYMDKFQDGRFVPDAPVTAIEYSVGIVKVLKITPSIVPSKRKSKLPLWVQRYIQTAIKLGFLDEAYENEPTKPVQIVTVMRQVQRLPQPELLLTYCADRLPNGDTMAVGLNQHLLQWAASKGGGAGSKPVSVAVSNVATITPPIQPTDSSKPVVESRSYIVQSDHPANDSPREKHGPDTVTVNTAQSQTKATVTVNALPAFADLRGHWIETTVRRMGSLGLLDTWTSPPGKPTENFYPRSSMSKRDFCVAIASMFSIPSSSNGVKAMSIADLDPADPAYPVVQRLLAAKIVSLDKYKRLSPEKALTKIEALTMMLRLSNIAPTVNTAAIPFRDVSTKSWYVGYLQAGLDQRFINPAVYFSPNAAITRAELVAMLVKTPAISLKIRGGNL